MAKFQQWLSAGGAMLVAASFCHAQDTQKLLLENEFVRVFEVRVPPGVFEPKHSHARGVTIALSDYTNEIKSYPEGKITEGRSKFGDVRWAEPVTHEARNTGTTEQRVIRIELKHDAPAAASPARPDELNALLACKDNTKLIFENHLWRRWTTGFRQAAASQSIGTPTG